MTTAASDPKGFATLAELQALHSALVREVGKDLRDPENLKQIAEFVREGVATGAVLDAYADRLAAQSLITYWTSRVASAFRWSDPADEPDFGDTLLEEFKPAELVRKVIDPADAWVAQQADADRWLVRSILLRLVRLRDDGSFEALLATSAVTEDLHPRKRADHLLRELLRRGIVRRTSDAACGDGLALRSAELLTRWPRLEQWLEGRKHFRKKATAYAQRRSEREGGAMSRHTRRSDLEKAIRCGLQQVGAQLQSLWQAVMKRLTLHQPSPAFLSDEEYDEAEVYRDRNDAELRLIYQKRQQDKQRSERNQVLAAVGVGVGLVFAGMAIWALLAEQAAEKAERTATEEKKKAVQALGEEKKAKLQAADAQYMAEALF